MTKRYVPEIWATHLIRSLAASFVDMYGTDDNNRPRLSERVDRTEEWKQARQAFINEWQTLTERGLALEYLEHDFCYECGGELKPNTDDTQLVWRDNPDYDAAQAEKTRDERAEDFITFKITGNKPDWMK